jgi:hypothetical protein
MPLTSTNTSMSDAVSATVEALNLETIFVSTARLAVRYAQLLDGAEFAERAADRVLRAAERGDDVELVEEVRALRSKLSARAAASDLGPKLEALLTDLGATPAASAKLAKLRPAEAPEQGDDWLSGLRSVRGA